MYRAITLAAIALTASCASILSDSVYPVNVSSDPSGANFVVSNRAGEEVESGTTPQVINLKSSSGYFKGETYQIVLSKPGFSDQVYTVSSSLDGWYWGNLLLGGLIGMLVVDPVTGAMYKLPDRIDVPLSESTAMNGETDMSIMIATIDTLSEEQRSRLQAIR
jgi:hypothetical protein